RDSAARFRPLKRYRATVSGRMLCLRAALALSRPRRVAKQAWALPAQDATDPTKLVGPPWRSESLPVRHGSIEAPSGRFSCQTPCSLSALHSASSLGRSVALAS